MYAPFLPFTSPKKVLYAIFLGLNNPKYLGSFPTYMQDSFSKIGEEAVSDPDSTSRILFEGLANTIFLEQLEIARIQNDHDASLEKELNSYKLAFKAAEDALNSIVADSRSWVVKHETAYTEAPIHSRYRQKANEALTSTKLLLEQSK